MFSGDLRRPSFVLFSYPILDMDAYFDLRRVSSTDHIDWKLLSKGHRKSVGRDVVGRTHVSRRGES